MVVSEQDSAFDHGQIPAHEARAAMNTSITLLMAKAGLGRHHACMLMFDCIVGIQQSTVHVAARSYMDMISDHFISYNKFSRPFIFYEQPRVDDPSIQYSSNVYYQLTGFWPEQLQEIFRELTLLPDRIRCRKTGCSTSKHLALFFIVKMMAYCR
jgi:hypothetical protein